MKKEVIDGWEMSGVFKPPNFRFWLQAWLALIISDKLIKWYATPTYGVWLWIILLWDV